MSRKKTEFIKDCYTNSIWCGKNRKPEYYGFKGSSYECLRKGFGRGYYTKWNESLSKNDLLRIPYLKIKHKNFLEKENIFNIDDLVIFFSRKSSISNNNLLKKIFNDDINAYNSIIIFLWELNMDEKNLPKCRI